MIFAKVCRVCNSSVTLYGTARSAIGCLDLNIDFPVRYTRLVVHVWLSTSCCPRLVDSTCARQVDGAEARGEQDERVGELKNRRDEAMMAMMKLQQVAPSFTLMLSCTRTWFPRARLHCRFVLPLILFTPDPLREPVPLSLIRQCD